MKTEDVPDVRAICGDEVQFHITRGFGDEEAQIERRSYSYYRENRVARHARAVRYTYFG